MVPVNERVKITNGNSGKVLEVRGEDTGDGGVIDQHTGSGKEHQRWKLVVVDNSNGTDIYRIENVHSRKVAEVLRESEQSGAEIVQRTYRPGAAHQQWMLRPVRGKNNVYKIVNRKSGKVMDVPGGSKNDGVAIKQYDSWNAPDARQEWQVVPAATGHPTPPDDGATIRGVLHGFGLNNEGQLGDGTLTQRTTPAKSPYLTRSTIRAISAGGRHSLALLEDGTVQAWGSQDYYQLGNPNYVDSPSPVPVSGLDGVTAISAGGWHNLALLDDGTVRAWGLNDEGELGRGSISGKEYQPATVVHLENVTAVSAGGRHSLALLDDGTVRAWGSQDWYQLGNGTYQDRYEPTEVLELDGVKAVSAGGWFNLALLEDGTLRAWGANDVGQLGHGTTSGNRYQPPVQVEELDTVKDIATGSHHCLAALADGTVWAWGYNGYGQLGDGTTTNHSRPVQVPGLDNVTAVAAGPLQGGSHHSLALKADGTVWAWGYNGYGQLGDGTVTNHSQPMRVLGLTGIKAVAAGGYHSITAG